MRSRSSVATGGYRVWVHIADVTHYVEPGSALDRQAAYRGNSVYLPGTVAPMLPWRLSNDVCSLRPYSERAAVTVEMEVSAEGETRSYRAFRSTIVSDARLTYEAVDAFLRGDGPSRGGSGKDRLRSLAQAQDSGGEAESWISAGGSRST